MTVTRMARHQVTRMYGSTSINAEMALRRCRESQCAGPQSDKPAGATDRGPLHAWNPNWIVISTCIMQSVRALAGVIRCSYIVPLNINQRNVPRGF